MYLVEFTKATLSDVPRVLRSIADTIEQGEYGEVTMAVVAIEGGDKCIETFGAGSADYYRAIALFNLALAKMTNDRVCDE